MTSNNHCSNRYENIEFNLSDGQSNYDLASNQTTFLSGFGTSTSTQLGRFPTYVQIRTNNTISVKLNSTSNHSITITSTDSPFVIEGVQISNVFLSNSSGSTAAVKLLLRDTAN